MIVFQDTVLKVAGGYNQTKVHPKSWCWVVCCNSPSNKQWWQRHMIKQVCGLRAKTPHLHFKCRVPSCSPKQFETGETWHVASGQAGIGKAMANLHENEINASCSQNEYFFRIKSKVNPENTSTFEFQCSNFCLAKFPPTCRSAQLHLRKLSLQRSSWGFFTGSCWTTGNTTNTHRLWTFRRGVVDVKNIGERTQWHT